MTGSGIYGWVEKYFLWYTEQYHFEIIVYYTSNERIHLKNYRLILT